MQEEKNTTSKIVDGYRKAFIDASTVSDPEYSPKLVTNSYGRKVLTVLEREMKKCDEMFISVAFITRGGIAPLLGTLKDLENRNIKGKILTTDYLLFSDPYALDRLNELNNIELRMFKTADEQKGFHTKGYLFQSEGNIRIIIGSSNLTQDAITNNYEWNTKIVSTSNGEFAKDVVTEFNDLWNSSVCYDIYRDEYLKNYQNKENERKQLESLRQNLVIGYSRVLEPNKMQETFINNLVALLHAEAKRALLVSATGTGKTYASAFAIRHIFLNSCQDQSLSQFSTNRRVLFVSHREQINRQAKNSYSRVFGKDIKMELLSGNNKDMEAIQEASFVFSTVQTISKDDVLKEFQPDDFSVIILDECHRTGAGSYQKIINYFKPNLLLGMSASPERTDGYDVFSLFDHNIACEIRLQQALENDLLCPFHYFGITDLEIDGEEAEIRDFQYLTSDKRVEYIISKAEYFGYSGDRVKGLIFCSSREEANELSNKFNATKRYNTLALSGLDSQEERETAIKRLVGDSKEGRLDYIFTVDIFNEGVDIPEINQVILLRPTESPIVFVQQLGRGLRKAEDKEFVVVLDFIGNYENNYMIPIALSGDKSGNKDNMRRSLMEGSNCITGASTIYFDEISRKRIYDSIDRATLNQYKLLKQEYFNLKYKLGRIPELKEFDEYGELDPMRIINHSKSYYEFLVKCDTDYSIRFDPIQSEMMNFVSTKFASGKRPHELVLLKILLNYRGENVISKWKEVMSKDWDISVDQFALNNVIYVLTNIFFNVGSAGKSFRNCIFLTPCNNGDYKISSQFEKALRNSDFRKELSSVINFGLSRYERDYSSHEKDSSFVLYKKYTYEDVCRLLNWSKNEVAITIGGYKYNEYTNTYPVFINYHKEEDINDTIRYEDRFINQSQLIAISKSRRNLQSQDVINALKSVERGIRMDLFVRKNKDDTESKEFYYLGPIVPTGFAKEFQMPNTDASAVEIGYKLVKPIEAGLYEYITETEL